jgi:glycogen phosphorylase
MQRFLTNESRIAYFTMEIALRNEIPTYSGGLGVLAGDTVRAAADLDLPMISVSLVSRAGYFKQQIQDGRQIEQADNWDPAQWATRLEAKVVVPIEGRLVWVGGWLYVLEAQRGGRQPVVLLDTDLDENRPEDRQLTHWLYGGDDVYRFKQEIILGIGGARMLQALGFVVRQYHLNEGHAALLTLELLRRYTYSPEQLEPGEIPYNVPKVRDLCSFTTHTPVEAGHDKFSYELVQRVLNDFVDLQTLRHYAGDDGLNMTRLALNLSEYVNGVAKSHAATSRQQFPGYHIHAITNGVHPFTWTAPGFVRVYDQTVPGWCHEPELLGRARCCISDEAIWAAHEQARTQLIAMVKARAGIELDPKVAILGFARRMTAYKRPELLFSDIARLRVIAARYPFQIVLAGKAHPHDENGKRLIALLHDHMRELAPAIRVAYLPNYDLETALAMVAGSDVWLNTPLPPMEASGTSGMKAAFNGVPSLSVLDGWWSEGCIEGITGWAIGRSEAVSDGHAEALYSKLAGTVLPLYYENRPGWIAVMKGTISQNASYFNSHRMMRRYAAEAYIR